MSSLGVPVTDEPRDVPPLTAAPLTRLTLALYCGASGDHLPLHVDSDWVREHTDLPDVIGHGMLTMAYLGRMLTDWQGPGSVHDFQVRFVAPILVRDEIVCTGSVIRSWSDGADAYAQVQIEAAVPARAVCVARGEATVRLRTRGPVPVGA